MPRRRYTAQQKTAAVAEASINGTEQASDATGIPESTIRYWLDKPEFAELRAKTRDEMRDGFKVLVHRAQERLTALVDSMEPRDLTILLGVATDKTLLMSGDATGRTETVSITDGLPADVKRTLRERLTRLVAEESTDRSAVGDADRPGEPVDTAAAPGSAD